LLRRARSIASRPSRGPADSTHRTEPLARRRRHCRVCYRDYFCEQRRTNEDHGCVANRMNGVTHQEDTDQEGHDGRDAGHTGGRDRTEVFNDEVVDAVRETRPKQPETNNQTCSGARICEYRSDPMETGHQRQKHHREPDLVRRQRYGRELQRTNKPSGVHEGASDAHRAGRCGRQGSSRWAAAVTWLMRLPLSPRGSGLRWP